jgi:hypothetical protein
MCVSMLLKRQPIFFTVLFHPAGRSEQDAKYNLFLSNLAANFRSDVIVVFMLSVTV